MKRKAAERGNVSAQYILGIMYEESRGVAKDYAEVEKWYWKSASQGYEYAATRLENLRQKTAKFWRKLFS